nr:trypsin-like peptidase domain-containing protein [Microbulbifer celer]
MAVAGALLILFPHLRGQTAAPTPSEARAPLSYASAVNLAGPAVVNIYTNQRLPQRRHPMANHPMYRRLLDQLNIPQQERLQSNLGSGVIVNDEGYILTNHHLIYGAEAIKVLLADGREAPVKFVGSDADFDLAVLKIDMSALTTIEVGDPENAQVGDVVLAIGNPFGLGQTVTQGIISATGRDLNGVQSFIQTDAAVNPGNSGGALVDARGKLLGINTSILNQSDSAGGISFAIPANIALKIMQDIIEFGRVVPGWLGIEAQTLNPLLARSFNLASTNGVIVTSIYNDGPAHLAGLQPGDVITHINDTPINDGKHGVAAMATLRPGETVTITFIRDQEVHTTKATVSERPEPQKRS